LQTAGYDSYGCDLLAFWEQNPETPKNRFALIEREPYRLPYTDGTFDN